MRALFAHDHPFGRSAEEHVLSPGKLPYAAWHRYLDVFRELIVIGRDGGKVENSEGWSRSDGPRVTFHLVGGHTIPDALFGSGTRANAIYNAVEGVDAVIARLPSLIGLAAGEAALRLGKPLAVELVGCPWDALRATGTVQGYVLAPVVALRTRRAVRRANAALYVTEHYLQRRYPSSGLATACANVMLPESNDDVLGSRLDREFKPIVGMIGTLHRYKGVEPLLRAVAETRREGHQIRLLHLGSGDKEPWTHLAKRLGISDFVEFHGMLPAGASVAAWLDRLDVYVQPSLTEGLPRALVEAMSRGLPAIGSAVGGIPELLAEDALHAPGDWKHLAARLSRALTNPEWRREQSQKNFARAKHFRPGVLSSVRRRFWTDFANLVEARAVGSVRTSVQMGLQQRPSDAH